MSLDGQPDVGPFCAMHRLDGRLIVAARQYHTDATMAGSLGLIR